MIGALQQSWDQLDFDRIATGIFGQLDIKTGQMTMASAGHYPPLLVQAGSASFLPVSPSTPLGVQGSKPSDWQGWLKDDQALLLYTDGAIDERGKGSERSMVELAHAAQASVGEGLDLSALCDGIVNTLSRDRADDVALLALRVGAA
jgi:serine/threonine-protein kinase RsbW